MKRSITIALGAAVVLAGSVVSGAAAQSSASGGLSAPDVHVFLTPHAYRLAHSLADERQGSPPLVNHGGPIMHAEKSYAIFWNPGQLQDGTPTQGINKRYKRLIAKYFGNTNGSPLFHNNVQYTSQGRTPRKTSFGATWIDRTPFPQNHCSYSDVGSNCVTDADIQARVIADATAHGISSSANKMFFVFTPENEGSCTDASCSDAAYEYYCAYHGNIPNAGGNLIYANMPFPTVQSGANCYYAPGGKQQFPSGDVNADAVLNVTSHEQIEAITDPQLNAWYDAAGYEIGDECAWDFGPTLADGGDVDLNGHPYGLQKEASNASQNCVLAGP